MNFNNNIPGILRHSLNSNVDSESPAITITAHKNVVNPIEEHPAVSAGKFRESTFTYLDTNRLKNAIELAKLDVIKMKGIQAEDLDFMQDDQDQNQNQIILNEAASRKSPTKTTGRQSIANTTQPPSKHEAEILANEIHQLTQDLPKIKRKTIAFTKEMVETESGLNERKRTLIKLNEKSRQISRSFYSLKTGGLRVSNGKVIKSAVKMVNLFYQCLPDLVALKNVQRIENLSWPELVLGGLFLKNLLC